MADASANPTLAPLIAATAAALSNAQILRAKLIGLETARPSFMANNSFADLQAYDQDIASTNLAVEQANAVLSAAESAETAALYQVDQQQKTAIFNAANLTNIVFWMMFEQAYDQAATRLMAVLEGADAMCQQIASINADSRPDNVQPLHYAGTVLNLIKSKLVIPSPDGGKSYFHYRQRTIPYADGFDPVGDFLGEVNAKAASLLTAATSN